MLKRLQKLPLAKRRIILWTVAGVVGIFLFSFQIHTTIEILKSKEDTIFSGENKGSISSTFQETRGDVINLFNIAREDMRSSMEVSEEEMIELLKEEDLISQDEINNLLKEEGLNKEDLKEGELIKLIEKSDLIIEKNEEETE